MMRWSQRLSVLLFLPATVLAQGRTNRKDPPPPSPMPEVTRLLTSVKRAAGRSQPPVTAFARALDVALRRGDRPGEAQVREERGKSLILVRDFDNAAAE